MTTKTDLLPLPSGNVAHLIAAQSAEIEALRAEVEKLQRAVPPGYALVPVEPTEDMQMAGDLVPPYPGDEGFGSQPDTLNIYRAMLAAAPKVEPVAQGDAEQRDEALLRQALEALERGAWDTLSGRNAAFAIRERLGLGQEEGNG